MSGLLNMDCNLAFAGENVAIDFTETLGDVKSVEHPLNKLHSSRLMTMESYIFPWSDIFRCYKSLARF